MIEILLSLWIAIAATNTVFLTKTFVECMNKTITEDQLNISISIIFWFHFIIVMSIISIIFGPFLLKKIMLESHRFEKIFNEIIDEHIND